MKNNNTKNANNKKLWMFVAGAILVVLLIRLMPCGGRKEGFSANAPKEGKLVMFYADWCGHCKAVKPTFQALKERYNTQYDWEDCSTPEKAKRFGITSFPTFRFFKNPRDSNDSSDYESYKGDRSMNALSSFMNVTPLSI